MTYNARNALDGKAYRLNINGGKVVGLDPCEEYEEDLYFSPGLIDIQVNGYGGVDYSGDFDNEGLTFVCHEMRKRGVFQHFPTIVTRPQNVILRNIRKIIDLRKKNMKIHESITGIHIEGPYISAEDGPRGAHDLRYVRAADIHELDEWIEASEGNIKIITIAPEVENALEFISYASSKGIICSIGHTNADLRCIEAAVQAGAKLSTHLGNGCNKLVDRSDNLINAQLSQDSLWASFIADGLHIPLYALKAFLRSKTFERSIIISDMAPVAGLPATKIKWGNLEVENCPDGAVRLYGSPYLAGAGSFLLDNINNLIESIGIPMNIAFSMVTTNPTNLFGLEKDRISINLPTSPLDVFIFRKASKFMLLNTLD